MRLASALLAVCLALAPLSGRAEEGGWQHAFSVRSQPKYPAGFTHFDYVNPQAPRGGVLKSFDIGGFDSLNIALTRGVVADDVSRIHASLMTPSLDEVDTNYPYLAEAIRWAPDFSTVSFRLRKEATFHDGHPITSEDVIFSFESFKKHSIALAGYYREIVKAEANGPYEVTFTAARPGNRELPLIIGQLTVLPKYWWTGTDASGKPRDIGQTTLEVPLGSGPYKISRMVAGQNVTFERVKDWWGDKVPAMVGRNNMAEIRNDYYRDDRVAFEAFKTGAIDWRIEPSAKEWATGYDFPAVKDGKVVKEIFANNASTAVQGIVMNLRRSVFSDIRVRKALNLMFDFEEMNRTLMFDAYKRTNSYWPGTELAGNDVPQGREKELLEELKDKVKPEVLTTAYTNPVGGTPEAQRANMREALRLFKEAGYELRERKMVQVSTAKPVELELLLGGPTFERHALYYKTMLERIGVTLTVRQIDTSQYVNRLRKREFDMVFMAIGQSLNPGNEQYSYWSSQAADTEGSQNYGGIKDPAVDALIDKLVVATTREELTAITRALDRVLLSGQYLIPNWYFGAQRAARWDRFSHPPVMPKYGITAFPDIWWFDEAKAAKAGR